MGFAIAELAQKAGIDTAGIEATVQRFNDHARRVDPDFNRGDNTYAGIRTDATGRP
jgi:3-oxosteroid 1-dehydrogenase